MRVTRAQIIDLLTEYAHIYDIMGKIHGESAYRRAITIIKDLPELPEHVDRLGDLRGIGKGILSKIKELDDGHAASLEALRANPQVKAYDSLLKVKGVGRKKAEELISDGITSIAALRKAVKSDKVKLTSVQQLGVVHYEDLATRIPRAEMHVITKALTVAAAPLEYCKVYYLGSYRRGAATSGDVDMLISGDDPALLLSFYDIVCALPQYVNLLTKGKDKFSFLYRGTRVRQVDVFYAPEFYRIPMILYGTGSAEHNEYIRGLCKSRGYRLNQRGLHKITREGKLEFIYLPNESAIYDLLKIPYVPPERR